MSSFVFNYFSPCYDYVLELLASKIFSLTYYKICRLECTEMAIWPLLYIKEEWCESKVGGQVYLFYKL